LVWVVGDWKITSLFTSCGSLLGPNDQYSQTTTVSLCTGQRAQNSTSKLPRDFKCLCSIFKSAWTPQLCSDLTRKNVVSRRESVPRISLSYALNVTEPTPSAVRCPTLRGPDHQTLSLHVRRTNGFLEARFRCAKGYRLEGSTTSICLDGHWSDSLPVCVPVQGKQIILVASTALTANYSVGYVALRYRTGITRTSLYEIVNLGGEVHCKKVKISQCSSSQRVSAGGRWVITSESRRCSKG
jgi:hypothetical protein